VHAGGCHPPAPWRSHRRQVPSMCRKQALPAYTWQTSQPRRRNEWRPAKRISGLSWRKFPSSGASSGRACLVWEDHAWIMMKMYHIDRFAVMLATKATMLMREWNEAEQKTDPGHRHAASL